MQYLEIDDENKYWKKNKGFTLPFSTHTKDNIEEHLWLISNY